MFTGIIIEMGDVVSLRRKQAGASLTISAGDIARDAAVGNSIAINGVCLTAVGINADSLSFDMSDETLNSTNLGQLRVGEKVNLEPSLRPDGKLGGHFVTGHVDAVGRIKSKTLIGDTYKIVIDAPQKVASLLVEKGSVAVDGISLTVVDVSDESFTVVIIPHTANVTTIGFKNVGDTVNLEADIIGKYVARFLNKDKKTAGTDNSLIESLTKAGYV